MAGGLNDLELETLEEINLSLQGAPRGRRLRCRRRARRIVSGVALGGTLTLALITSYSRYAARRAAPLPGVHSTGDGRRSGGRHPVAVRMAAAPSSHAACTRTIATRTTTRGRRLPAAAAAEVLATAQSIPVGIWDPPVSKWRPRRRRYPPKRWRRNQPRRNVQSAVADAAATALVDAMAALKEAQAAGAAEEPIDIQGVSESERRFQEMSIDGRQVAQAPTPREPARGRGARDRDARDHAPAPPRRRRRVVGARLLRRLAEATY